MSKKIIQRFILVNHIVYKTNIKIFEYLISITYRIFLVHFNKC